MMQLHRGRAGAVKAREPGNIEEPRRLAVCDPKDVRRLLSRGVVIAFTKMHKFEDIEPVDILAGCARFIIVGCGGVFFGVIFGFISAFITRFTQNISAIEPLIVFMFSYLSYLVAETACHTA